MKLWQQNLVPQHFLSHLMGKLANAKMGALTHFAIKKFIAHYGVNLGEAKIDDYKGFESFNDFFTRELKAGVRLMPTNSHAFISPVDGCISECGLIREDQLLQAKGSYFGLRDLLGGDEDAAGLFEDGNFMTIYLSPKDYHRFHMPIAGELKKMIYVPGKLFSVNPASVNNVPGLFAKNERVVCIFETAIGKVALIAVGAMIVGSMSMKWHGIVGPQSVRQIKTWEYDAQQIILNQGDEVGHFRLGSTVILLTEKNKLQWDAAMQAEKVVRLYDPIATRV